MGEPGVDAGGLEREWFLLVCNALFDPSTGLFSPQPSNGAFAINPASGVANEMHLEYFRFAGRVRIWLNLYLVPGCTAALLTVNVVFPQGSKTSFPGSDFRCTARTGAPSGGLVLTVARALGG